MTAADNRFDALVRDGSVVSGSGVRLADIGVRGETIAAIGSLRGAQAELIIGANGRYVLPGIIDAHNHPVYADHLGRLSMAGAAGGVTTVISFVGALPAWGFDKTRPLEVARKFAETWTGRTACDFGLHVAIDSRDDLAADIGELVEFGVTSFKFFMAYRQRGMMLTDDSLIANLDVVARHGALAIVHAENGAGIAFLEARDWDADRVDNARFLECHTDLLESEATLRAIALADAVGCPLYVPHVAAAKSLEVIRLARKSAGIPIWAETCPHYLLLTNDEVLQRGALAKIAPPLRHDDDNRALWDGLVSGSIDVVASDHAPNTMEMKSQGRNLLQAAYGGESIEHLLLLMYSEGVVARHIALSRLAQVMAENPADIFGLAPHKGRLQVGGDADLVVVDPSGRRSLGATGHRTAADYCLYEGRECEGTVELTMRRGQVIFSDGQAVADTAGGQFLKRAGPPLRREVSSHRL